MKNNNKIQKKNIYKKINFYISIIIKFQNYNTFKK